MVARGHGQSSVAAGRRRLRSNRLIKKCVFLRWFVDPNVDLLIAESTRLTHLTLSLMLIDPGLRNYPIWCTAARTERRRTRAPTDEL